MFIGLALTLNMNTTNYMSHLLRVVAKVLLCFSVFLGQFEKPYLLFFHDPKKRDENCQSMLSKVETFYGLVTFNRSQKTS